MLAYDFSVAKAADVVINFAGISQYLYESELDCCLWQLFNSDKQLVGVGYSFPLRVSIYTSVEMGRIPPIEQLLAGSFH